MRTTIIHWAALALAMLASSARAEEPAPDALLRAVTAEITSLARENRGHLNAAKTGRVNEMIDRKILPLFDFGRMTQAAMGRNWTIATPEQRDAVTREFTALLVCTYSVALKNYRDETIEFKSLDVPEGATLITVKSVVKQESASRMSIDYDMGRTVAGWKVFEIRIDGVNIIANYRDTFASKVRTAGVDGLIRALAEKNGNYPGSPQATAGRSAAMELSQANRP